VNRLFLIASLMAALVSCATPGSSSRQPHLTVPSTTASPLATGAPTEIDIPSINAHSSLIPLELIPDGPHKGALAVPDVKHPEQAGWYANGVAPCGPAGPAVVVGHIDGAGKHGVFYNLKKLASRDTISITMTSGSCTYTVYQTMHVDKNQFPSERVYGNTPGPEIRLITCGDQFVGGELGYKNNIIVFGKLNV
jgi:sortase (surface protein transpeptidase)